jgi:hypothetical protein
MAKRKPTQHSESESEAGPEASDNEDFRSKIIKKLTPENILHLKGTNIEEKNAEICHQFRYNGGHIPDPIQELFSKRCIIKPFLHWFATSTPFDLVPPKPKKKYLHIIGEKKNVPGCEYTDFEDLRIYFFYSQKLTNWLRIHVGDFLVITTDLQKKSLKEAMGLKDMHNSPDIKSSKALVSHCEGKKNHLDSQDKIMNLLKDGKQPIEVYREFREDKETILEFLTNSFIYEKMAEYEEKLKKI